MKALFLLIMIIVSIGYGQNIEKLESVYEEYRSHLNFYQNRTDSVQNKLDIIIDRIDMEKGRENPDEEMIAEMMAQALSLSDIVDAFGNRIETLQDTVEHVGLALNERYTYKIDSLSQTMKNNTDEQNEVLLLRYILKRMRVSPVLPELSFDPLVLESVQIDTADTETDFKIYSDFLSKARAELTAQYEVMVLLEQNVGELIRLEEKAMTFLDDVEDGAMLPVGDVRQNYSALSPAEYHEESNGNMISESASRMSNLFMDDHIRSVLMLNHQLLGSGKPSLSQSEHTKMSNEDYLKMIHQTKKSLEHYLETTRYKLGKLKTDE